MIRRLLPALAVLALAAPAAAGAPNQAQTFFRAQVLADNGTTDTIVDLLRHGGGFVANPVRFADLTGDGKQDAVVRVDTGGAAGVVALYIFSTDGKNPTGQLRVVFRQQALQRASLRIRKAGLSFRTATYAAGDAICCPSTTTERDVRWDPKKRRFAITATRDVAPPGG